MTATIDAAVRAFGCAREVRAAEPDGEAAAELRYQPVLDVQHGTTAGYQLLPNRRGLSAAAVTAGLSIAATLPAGVFLSALAGTERRSPS